MEDKLIKDLQDIQEIQKHIKEIIECDKQKIITIDEKVFQGLNHNHQSLDNLKKAKKINLKYYNTIIGGTLGFICFGPIGGIVTGLNTGLMSGLLSGLVGGYLGNSF